MPGSLVTLVTWVTYCSFWMIAQEIEDACVTGNFGNLGNFKSNNIRGKMDCRCSGAAFGSMTGEGAKKKYTCFIRRGRRDPLLKKKRQQQQPSIIQQN